MDSAKSSVLPVIGRSRNNLDYSDNVSFQSNNNKYHRYLSESPSKEPTQRKQQNILIKNSGLGISNT